MKLLVTGFEPFGEVAENPSQKIIESLQSRHPEQPYVELVRMILPVDYKRAEQQLYQYINSARPAAIVMLGVAPKRKAISIERFALNIDDAPLPDNAGAMRQGEMIRFDAPSAYMSTLPVRAMASRLDALDIPVELSNHAGAYLCNHVFFAARDYCERYKLYIPAGFIHLPAIGDEPPAMPFDTMLRGVRACLDVVASSILYSYA